MALDIEVGYKIIFLNQRIIWQTNHGEPWNWRSQESQDRVNGRRDRKFDKQGLYHLRRMNHRT